MQNVNVEDSGFVLEMKKSNTAVRLSADGCTTGISVQQTPVIFLQTDSGFIF